MEQMRIKHNETGRSMVEMLGVLAVVGVLSIGGVAGYRYAVDKMNANEIINELKKRAITASQQRVLSQNINLAEYGAILGKYEVTPANGYPEDPAFFGLEIKAVPQKVCQHIVDSDWAMPTEMKIGNLIMDKDTECPNEFNDISFAFHNTLDQTKEIGEIITPPEQPTQKCETGYYPLPDGTCKEDTKCSDPNQFWNSWKGRCDPCPTDNNPIRNDVSVIEDSCLKCTGAQLSAFYCVWCPSNRVACGNTCCEAGEQCQVNTSNWPYTYTCVSGLGQNECLTNADCNKNGKTGEYCKNESGCGQTIGTCEPATLDNGGVGIDFYGTAVYLSQDSMSWYAAKNFCEAHNMSLLNLRDYCTDNEWSSIQSYGNGSCTNLAVTNDYWHGWTGTDYASCVTHTVDLLSGAVSYRYRYGNNAALCVGDGEWVPPVVSTEVTTQTETTTTATQTQTVTETASASEECSNPCYEICCPDGYTCDRVYDYPAFCVSSTSCTTNADCSSDAYCDYNKTECINAKPETGVCKALLYEERGDFTVSKNQMNYWSAQNFCKRMGKAMASKDSVASLDTNNIVTFWTSEMIYCYDSGCSDNGYNYNSPEYGSDDCNGLDGPQAVCK